ncbi:ribonuclease HI [Allopseudospirillum japonicum]|uniref:Ribonuclease H n=1 Tax=Allopseudospirillum japonicum TaxID=64971 RepID=A0A1H6Q2R5_9GAMM|nr:ribonuclease HI [Allopseudospirillum japonicum]SEI38128.1 ribonuclease HI [Allopseudospirillum japonicum]
MPANKSLVIYTDGACKGNPGVGGWGAWLQYGEHEKMLKGAQAHTTNNRMELMAAIEALKALKRPCTLTLITDSIYLRDGVNQWLANWKARHWQTASKKPVKNQDLWQALDHEIQRHQIQWQWVKGHSGDPGNEKADELANQAISEFLAQGK